ncbi:histidine kinase [Chloroflexota bacterium]
MTAIPLVAVSYYHFVRAYNNKPNGIVLYLGYTFVLIILAFSLGGYVVKSAYIVDGFLYHEIKPWDDIIAAGVLPLLTLEMWMLVRRYRSSTDLSDRNRTSYLIFGWSILLIFSYVTPFTPALAGLPTDHIGNLFNALIISYAIYKYQLLDIKLVLRKGLVYSTLTVLLTASYLLLIFILQRSFSDLTGYGGLALAITLAILVAIIFNPFRNFIQERIDRIFFRETYDYRQMLLHFSDKVSNVLDLDELAQSILDPVVNGMHVRKAALLFPEIGSGDFTTKYSRQKNGDGPIAKLKFNSDNPIVTWLATEGKALSHNLIDIMPQFKGLWEIERTALNVLDIELLCPIRSKGKLIGILALSEKQSESLYSDEEVNLLMTMANEAGVVVENARMLDSLKSQQLQVEQLLAQVVLAQEEERNRISIDLHDSVAQWLVGASYRLQTFDRIIAGDERARREVADMEQTVTKSLKELRRVVVGLRPPALDELGLTHALRQSLEELQSNDKDCRFTLKGQPFRLPSSMEITIYRVVQESLSNIRKHSEASKITLSLQFQKNLLTVEIGDNGKGFDLNNTLGSAIAVGHMGLLGMKQRAEMLGGDIKMRSKEGVGTTVTFSLPVQSDKEEK